MHDNDDIPLLTDLIKERTEEKIEITAPDLSYDTEDDLIIDEDDEPGFSFDAEELETVVHSRAATGPSRRKELEQSIRYILNEHLELAWMEIRQAIEVAFDDEDNNS